MQQQLEQQLRAIWSANGVPKTLQDTMIADIIAKARPGARVGPFVIGGERR